MHKAFKYRLKPTEKQITDLKQIGGGCRWLWNQMLAANKAKHEEEKKLSEFKEVFKLWKQTRYAVG